MIINGFNKTTLLDYPGLVAATIFVGNCNFRCPFCHNSGLVLSPDKEPVIPTQEVLSFLKKRFGILTGVCITGGEPTLQTGLADFIRSIKELGYQIKLDTNGYRPEVIKALHEQQLLDMVAMDIKSCPSQYGKVTGLSQVDMNNLYESVSFLMSCGIPYEFRTTVVKELHQEQDFIQIGEWIKGASSYYLQNFTSGDQIIQPGFSSYSKEELQHFATIIKPYVPNVSLRGVD